MFVFTFLSVMRNGVGGWGVVSQFCNQWVNSDSKQPQTKNGVDSFGGLGATLVDSLDTLFIMGLHEQFQRAKE
jgi:hypothetical protein